MFVNQSRVETTFAVVSKPTAAFAGITGENMIYGGIIYDSCAGTMAVHGAVTLTIGAPPGSPANTKCPDDKSGGDSQDCSDCGSNFLPMAGYTIHSMLASLNVHDTPLRYTPAFGPAVSFTATYNQRENQQPAAFNYGNMGPKWTFGWLSFLTDDPSSQRAVVPVYTPAGGAELFAYDSGSQAFLPDPQSHAILVNMGSGIYERRMPDGSKQVFAQSDGATSYPRRIFMTAMKDSVGNTLTINYDSSLRVSSITDATWLTTTLSYQLTGDSLKVTKVTDPFGRYATFDYTSGKLTKITDEIGIQSQFTYASGTDSINSLTTPYGTTNFVTGEDSTGRWVEATDPRGGKERVEYRSQVTGFGFGEAVPSISGATTTALDSSNTFFWSKKSTDLYPPVNGVYDYSKATVTHWLYGSDGLVSGIIASKKQPLENRVWYTYPDQPDSSHVGSSASPSQIARVLDDNITQLSQFTYNTLGNITKEIDPSGRVTTRSYDSNNIDLLAVYQRNSSGASTDPENQAADKILVYTYDAANEPPHKPKTMKDAAGQTTTYHYNSAGQVLTVTNAKSETTTYVYGTGTTVPTGYLASITSPLFGSSSHAVTSFGYDSKNRVHTVTNSPDNYTVTTDYDNLDRRTQVTYPDLTAETFDYTDSVRGMTLDLTVSKDRLDRWTTRHYNANRQMDSMTDPLSQITLYDWCTCGSLAGITDPNGNVTTFGRDLQSRVISKGYADTTSNSYTYENTTSRLKSMTDALNQTTHYTYFVDNNLQQTSYTSTVNPTPSVSYTYDPNYNRVGAMMDGTGTTTYSYYPVTSSGTLGANQLYQVDGPFSSTSDRMTYTYDQLGRVLSQDINGTTSSMTYDSLGRTGSSSNALGSFSRAYDGVTPRLQTLTYPNGQTANYSYYGNTGDRRLQTLHNTTGSSANLSSFTYSYDPVGTITAINRTLGSSHLPLWFDYDDAQQLGGARNSWNPNTASLGLGYFYDAAGNRVGDSSSNPSLSYSNGVFRSYTVNNLNQIDSVSVAEGFDSSGPSAVTYDADGNMTYDGGNQTFEWDAANRLVAINYLVSGDRTEFAYDGLSRRVKITEYGPGVTATVQPTGSSYTTFTTSPFSLPSGSYTLTFAGLNPNGGTNIALLDSVALNSTTVANGSFESPSVSDYQANPSDTYWTYSADSGIAHNSGTYTSSNPSAPAGSQVAFIKNNGLLTQIWSASSGNYTLSFKAAQRGSNNDSYQQLRVNLRPSGSAISVKNFVWCGNQVCEERDASNNVTKRYHAEGEKRIGGADAGNYYYSRDHLGSIREVTNSSGTLTAQYDYDPYGQSVVVSGTMTIDFGFTGHYFHAPSGLNLTLYRAYESALGRWISRDPMAEKGGLNLYAYVGNDPINRIDVFGLSACTDRCWEHLEKCFSTESIVEYTLGGATLTTGLQGLNLGLGMGAKPFPSGPSGLNTSATRLIGLRLGGPNSFVARLGKEIGRIPLQDAAVIGAGAGILSLHARCWSEFAGCLSGCSGCEN